MAYAASISLGIHRHNRSNDGLIRKRMVRSIRIYYGGTRNLRNIERMRWDECISTSDPG
ncbi:hypothetical protein BDN70DRAFT_885779 [Pholiota conissans]|uniref:Uncharacterized protein n=1 Tax=Pholiota conissans TaxID=109636 RepID=A0A9P6CUT5_9AGAR|nr:hypothetical protein BDN70DRAFT_885779 [Pholiota conissans]